ncbi:SIS domain-containing protein [Streptococcus uberis]|nr:SIS domain-containing protein [Streptococcus uberis]
MFINEKIELSAFSPSEQKVVDFILKEKEHISEWSTSQIAKETYTSKSTLVRIAQKLGFSGWTSFRQAFHEEVTYLLKQADARDANLPFDKTDNNLEIASKLAHLKKEVIDETLHLSRNKDLNKAIHLISHARTVHLFAASNNLHNGREFAHNMKRIQKDVQLHDLHGEIHFDALLAEEDSCAIIISYSGGTLSLIKVAQILRKKEIPIIALTSLGDNPISQLSQVTLRLSTKEKLYSKIGTYATDTSITFILDLLYSIYFRQNYDYNLAFRQKTSQEIETERFSYSPITEETSEF